MVSRAADTLGSAPGTATGSPLSSWRSRMSRKRTLPRFRGSSSMAGSCAESVGAFCAPSAALAHASPSTYATPTPARSASCVWVNRSARRRLRIASPRLGAPPAQVIRQLCDRTAQPAAFGRLSPSGGTLRPRASSLTCSRSTVDPAATKRGFDGRDRVHVDPGGLRYVNGEFAVGTLACNGPAERSPRDPTWSGRERDPRFQRALLPLSAPHGGRRWRKPNPGAPLLHRARSGS